MSAKEGHKKGEDEQLLMLLDDDPTQTQLKLNVPQKKISRYLRAIGKINKHGRWVQNYLNKPRPGFI